MHYLDSMKEAAHAGGEIVRNYFGASLELTQKTTVADVRTQADIDSEAAILNILESNHPEFSIISEERGVMQKTSAYTFVIDPLDGTHNFTLGIPLFSISIGLKKDEEIIAGVIYHVMLDELYYAERGCGAFRNDEPIHVNAVSKLSDATCSYVARYGVPQMEEAAIFSASIDSDMKRLVAHWSPAIDFCLLASGRIESILVSSSEIYDYIAGKIIALEAGAHVVDFSCHPETSMLSNRFIVSNNEQMNRQVYSVFSIALRSA